MNSITAMPRHSNIEHPGSNSSHRLELWLWVLLLAICNLSLWQGQVATQNLFVPELVIRGEWARLILSPFTHLSWYHLALDGAAFLLLWRGLENLQHWQRWGTLAGCWIGSLACPAVLSPEIDTLGLCGLSGIAHGLFAVTALQMLTSHSSRSTRTLGIVLLAGLLGKTLLELHFGGAGMALLHPGDVGIPIASSHLGGILGGGLAFGLLCLFGNATTQTTAADQQTSTQETLLPDQQIIDMHVHTAGIGAGGSGCFISAKMRRNWRYKIYLKAFGVTEADLQTHGDALAFQRIADKLAASQTVGAAVVLALDGVVDDEGMLDLSQTETYVPNDFVARETAKHPNLLYGASVNPYRQDALARLEEAVAGGAVLLKWLPAIQQIDPADERLIPFYRKLVELELPLLTHAGAEKSFTTAHTDLGDPERLRLPLSLGVTVIAAHAATTGKSDGEDNMTRLLRMFPEFPNLYADISSLTQLNKLVYLPRLLKHDVHERLIYGTDFPLINTALVSPWHHPLRLSFGQMRRISATGNPWDRDVALKTALGVPPQVFTRWHALLKSRNNQDIR